MNQTIMNQTSISIPYDIVLKVLQYDNRFAIRNGKIMNRISKNDFRYEMVSDIFDNIPPCQLFIYGPPLEIDLIINKNKSYVITVDEIYYRNFGDDNDYDNHKEIVKTLHFHRSLRNAELLFEC